MQAERIVGVKDLRSPMPGVCMKPRKDRGIGVE